MRESFLPVDRLPANPLHCINLTFLCQPNRALGTSGLWWAVQAQSEQADLGVREALPQGRLHPRIVQCARLMSQSVQLLETG